MLLVWFETGLEMERQSPYKTIGWSGSIIDFFHTEGYLIYLVLLCGLQRQNCQ